MGVASLVDEPIDVAAVSARVGDASHGAVVVFVGAVRDQHQGRAVAGIGYHAYRPMAERVLAELVAEQEASVPGIAAAVVHRLGELVPGEASVVIAVASPRRDAAFDGARRLLERLKAEVPIWKREHYADGSSAWREEEVLAPVERG